jgi:hypothetical protein
MHEKRRDESFSSWYSAKVTQRSVPAGTSKLFPLTYTSYSKAEPLRRQNSEIRTVYAYKTCERTAGISEVKNDSGFSSAPCSRESERKHEKAQQSDFKASSDEKLFT